MKRALYALINQVSLTEAEVTNLTLTDLQLAGSDPSIVVLDDDTGEQRTVSLSDQARNALVTWMLVRPDRPVPLLFPGENDNGFTVDEVKALLADYEPATEATATNSSPISSQTIAEEELPEMGPSGADQESDQPPTPPREPLPPPFKTTPPSFSPEQVTSASRSEDVPPVAEETSPEPDLVEPVWPERRRRRRRRRGGLPVIVVILGLVLCATLVAGGIFMPEQFAPVVDLSGQLARSVGLSEQFDSLTDRDKEQPSATPNPVDQPLVVSDETGTPAEDESEGSSGDVSESSSTSPISTPTPEATATLPPTATPTATSTETPIPDPTATPEPTNTPEPTATPSPEPTATPEPTDTPTPEPSDADASASDLESDEPTATPTPGFKYATPELIAPDPDFIFINGNTIRLQWEAVGELGPNEQYAVRLVYFHGNEVVYKGEQLQETEWTVPLNLYHEADGPEFEYYWYVYVERIRPDGIGVPISPESEHRFFIWD